MYERLEICPNCKHTKFNNKLIIQDHSISKESFALSECDKCGLLFTNPRPSQENIGNYYESKDYISHHDDSSGLLNEIYRIARTFNLRYKFDLIRKYHPQPGRLLDFGSGTGHFLQYARTKNWEVNGIEPNQSARSRSLQLSDNQVYSELKPLSKDDKYHIITAWHVLEHVHDLKNTLKGLKNLLLKDGKMLVALPNYLSFDAKLYGEYWAGYDVPRHLFHFSPEVFQDIARSRKLEVIDQWPLKMDAYYVSLLSEKYKGMKYNYLKPVLTGLKSNRDAAKTGNYSSLIYVLQHA